MHSWVQWSTAMKIVAVPSSVQAPVASVPHISSGRLVVMVPSCALGPWGLPTRVGARRSASRINRSTRALLVRCPWSRSRAQTLRCPSPSQGEVRIASRISSVSSASLHAVFGPRLRGGVGLSSRARVA